MLTTHSFEIQPDRVDFGTVELPLQNEEMASAAESSSQSIEIRNLGNAPRMLSIRECPPWVLCDFGNGFPSNRILANESTTLHFQLNLAELEIKAAHYADIVTLHTNYGPDTTIAIPVALTCQLKPPPQVATDITTSDPAPAKSAQYESALEPAPQADPAQNAEPSVSALLPTALPAHIPTEQQLNGTPGSHNNNEHATPASVSNHLASSIKRFCILGVLAFVLLVLWLKGCGFTSPPQPSPSDVPVVLPAPGETTAPTPQTQQTPIASPPPTILPPPTFAPPRTPEGQPTAVPQISQGTGSQVRTKPTIRNRRLTAPNRLRPRANTGSTRREIRPRQQPAGQQRRVRTRENTGSTVTPGTRPPRVQPKAPATKVPASSPKWRNPRPGLPPDIL